MSLPMPRPPQPARRALRLVARLTVPLESTLRPLPCPHRPRQPSLPPPPLTLHVSGRQASPSSRPATLLLAAFHRPLLPRAVCSKTFSSPPPTPRPRSESPSAVRAATSPSIPRRSKWSSPPAPPSPRLGHGSV